ncbi:MAG: DegT/DnrJ/EryC1/StrS family aminotransferase [Pseudomonadota bacterium]
MIQRNATDSSRFARRWIFTRSARTAWELILRAATFSPGTSVLLPAYIGVSDREGSGVFDPVVRTQTPFTFYPVDERLHLNLDDIAARLRTGLHPMLLAVHWFGLQHVDMTALRSLCAEYDVWLVEDCAHVPGPGSGTTGPGSFGAAAFHSLHKIIAVPDGGALRINDPRLATAAPQPHEQCSGFALEQLLRTDMDAVAATRRANYSWLTRRLAATPGIEVLYPSIGDAVPHDFPIRILGGIREKLYFALMDQRLPTVALYYRLVPEIAREEFPASHALSASILNLPVHQDTSERDLGVLCDAMEAVLPTLRL